MVRVLILVDENVSEFFLIICEHIRLVLQKADGIIYEIVEVHSSGVLQVFGIGCIDLRRADAADITGALLGGDGLLR